MQAVAPEYEQHLRQHQRALERELRKDRPKLFRALEEFANIRRDKDGWAHFRRKWENFFPKSEYDRVEKGDKPSIFDYPFWLEQVWKGQEIVPCLDILLGIAPTPEFQSEGLPEEAWLYGLKSIPPDLFQLDWERGTIRYSGGCDFQRALYLLFRESWRAKVCEKCGANFIAKGQAAKYCSTDCSETAQREVKREWWAAHGEKWRKERKTAGPKAKGKKNVTRKTR